MQSEYVVRIPGRHVTASDTQPLMRKDTVQPVAHPHAAYAPAVAQNTLVKGLPIAFDVSDRSLHLVQLGAEGGPTVYARQVLAPGIVHDGVIQKQEEFQHALAKLLELVGFAANTSHDSNAWQAAIVLPESQTYIHRFSLESHHGDVSCEQLTAELERTLPLPLADVVYDYVVLNKATSVDVLCVAARKRVIQAYVEAFAYAGVGITVVDAEATALGRAVLSRNDSVNALVVDIGAHATTLASFMSCALQFSALTPVGGDVITTAIMQAYAVPHDQAEVLKRTHGLLGESALRSTIQGSLQPILVAIRRALAYQSSYKQEPISSIVLAGGSAQMAGLASYIEGSVHIPTQVGDSLINFAPGSATVDHPIVHASLLGLALRSVDHRETDINLLPQGVHPCTTDGEEGVLTSLKRFF